MIQKVIYSSIKTTKSVALRSKQTNLFYNPIEKEFLSNKKNIKFAQIKRFFSELKSELNGFYRKIFKNAGLQKTNKVSKSNIMYDEKMKKELEEQAKQRNMVKWRKEENEKLIKNSGHSVSSGDIDQNGYLTSSGQKKLDNPAFKGAIDDLDFDNNLEKQLTKNHDIDSHSIDVDDKYAELINGDHSNNLENETSHSLLEVLQENHNKNQHLENIDDIVEDGVKHIDESTDDLTTYLFD